MQPMVSMGTAVFPYMNYCVILMTMWMLLSQKELCKETSMT